MKIYIRLLPLIILAFFSLRGFAQQYHSEQTILWKGVVNEDLGNGTKAKYIFFEGANLNPTDLLPLFSANYKSDYSNPKVLAFLTDTLWKKCNTKESQWLSQQSFQETECTIQSGIVFNRKKPEVLIEFTPLRFNVKNNQFEKLIQFTLDLTISQNPEAPIYKNAGNFAEHSVLSSGQWAKIRVKTSAVYKINYNDLISYGFDPTNINPQNIRLFGNAGGMLPESNSTFRYDDLMENAIFVAGSEDGTFDPEDYILFYGMSPHVWSNVLGFLLVQRDYYDDYNYYFLTVGDNAGKRMAIQNSEINFTKSINYFNNFQQIEDDEINLILSGKTWYGDEFGITNSRTYTFNFPQIVTDKDVVVKTSVANRTFENDEMVITINNDSETTIVLTQVDAQSTKFAQKKKKTINALPNGPLVSVKLDYYPASPSSRMWLDFINVNAISRIQVDTGQLLFRELNSVADGAITKFVIENSTLETQVLEVTNPLDAHFVQTNFANGQTQFILRTDSLREFIAFDGSMFLSPEWVGAVSNQDIHGTGPVDYVIVSHPLFTEQANRLKDLHVTTDGLTTIVVSPEEVYNEFSSGKQDPTAIRNMMKMYYDRYPGEEPQYLLLFGDGSFDPKDRLDPNSNFIPTFQTEESWTTATSYVIDDYFGLLDDNEGNDAIGVIDLGIGRIPVQTQDEARDFVDKIYRYLMPKEPQFGIWRNTICIIADDEDGNLHLQQADSLASYYGYIPEYYNIDKIYLDAYPQVATPSGNKYPEVTKAINKQVADGALLINYVGHGGIGGWAHERIMQQSDFQSWSNADKLPAFVTATCEFSRFDDPEIVSGGELVLLNPNGGGIALFTTTRLAYSQSNFRLNERLLLSAFIPIDGEMPRLGDLIRESKPPGQLTTRNFVLLGDPALQLAYPNYKVQTTVIDGNAFFSQICDTINSLQEVTISGEITDENGLRLNNFNGHIISRIYDKETVYKTFANDPASLVTEFVNQDKIIWEGKSTVSLGSFTFTFFVPKDIALNFGYGKISYYAFSDQYDASGSFSNFIIGGLNPQADTDIEGPKIQLFINDTDFVSGDQTNDSPVFLAFLQDEHGINLSSSGMGHEIILLVNDDYSGQLVMNKYFKWDIDSYKNGSIEYPFYSLPDGSYTLQLKAWDTYNNSSTKSISFVINRNANLWLSNVKNSPNPFKDETTFSFQHTRPGDNLTIQLQIFNLTGKNILSYETNIFTEGTETPFLTWNATDVNGAKIRSGVYIYRIKVTDESGNTSIQQQKLILQ